MKYALLVLFTITPLYVTALEATADCNCTPTALVTDENLNKISSTSYVLNLSKQLEEIGFKCPQKIWSDYSLKDIQYVLVDHKTKSAWTWNDGKATKPNLTPYPYEKIEGNPKFQAPFDFLELNGKKTVSLNLNQLKKNKLGLMKTNDPTLQIAYHEPFHMYYQIPRGWSTDLKRGIRYPIDLNPRLFRAQIVVNLKKAYAAENEETRMLYLSHAKYWLNKYKTYDNGSEYSEIKSVDILEGTAKYVDTIAGSISRLPKGCASTEKDIKLDILNQLESEIDLLERPDLESYLVGLFSLLLLRDQKYKYTDSERLNGNTPIEILLKDISPTAEPEDSRLTGQKLLMEQRYNKELGTKMEKIKKAYEDNDLVRISITDSSTYTFSQMVRPAFLQNASVLTGASLNISSTDNRLKAENVTVILEDNQCGKDQKVILARKDQIKQTDDGLLIQKESIPSDRTSYNGILKTNNTPQPDKKTICVGKKSP